jgi:L-2-hydroxyglutarate oxidase LhgO
MEESKRGCPGFINLIGMESPGLTSSIAIGNYVSNLIN